MPRKIDMRIHRFLDRWIDFDHVLSVRPLFTSNGVVSSAELTMMFRDETIKVQLIYDYKSFSVDGELSEFANKRFDLLMNLWRGKLSCDVKDNII